MRKISSQPISDPRLKKCSTAAYIDSSKTAIVIGKVEGSPEYKEYIFSSVKYENYHYDHSYISPTPHSQPN